MTTMKTKVNLQLLATTRFDSGALGPLAMVVHQFSSTGRYQAVAKRDGHAVADVDFQVDEESTVMQLDVDLAEADRAATARPEGCGCDGELAARVVSPEGHVLFHASSRNGYSVTVASEAGELVFDSSEVGDGDLFAVSLLEPATYSMSNTAGKAAGEIVVVSPPTKGAERMKDLETRYVDATRNKFDPERVELTSTQGLVFRIQGRGAARIVIEKASPPAEARQDRLQERSKPAVRWQKHSGHRELNE